MKKVIAIAVASVLTTGAFAQTAEDEIHRVEVQSKVRDDNLRDLIDFNANDTAKRLVFLSGDIIRARNESIRRDLELGDRIDATDARVDLLQERVDQNQMSINGLGEDISHLRSDMYSGLAGVAAMGAIPEARAGSTSIGVGYGNFGNQDAAAFGISHRTENGKHAFSLSGTVTQRENGVAAGYSYSF